MINNEKNKQQKHQGISSDDKVVGCAVVSIDHKWAHISKLLKKQIGDIEYRRWISPLSVCSIQSKVVEIAAPTRFIRDWVSMHYADRINRIWDGAYPSDVIGIDIIVAPELKISDNPANNHDQETSNTITAQPYAKENEQTDKSEVNYNKTKDMQQMHTKCNLDPRFTFDSFVVGKSNELATAAAKRIVESETVSFNPLFLYSGVGLGKTHLMHAVGWAIREKNPARKVLYMSAEKFMYEFIQSLQNKSAMSFKENFRSVDVLMIDDVQFIGGKNKIQDEFFHTFNALVDQNRQIIISADRPPSDIEGLSESLRSRLGWGLVADIHQTDYELRLEILKSKLKNIPSIEIPEQVLEFLAQKITSNVRELEGALNRVIMQAELTGQSITITVVKLILQDLLRANEHVITTEDIQKYVAQYYNIRLSDMHSARRSREIARPRQIAMYITKALTPSSLPEIGRKFGGRDHTTVLYAIRKIEELLPRDAELAKDIDTLMNNIKHI